MLYGNAVIFVLMDLLVLVVAHAARPTQEGMAVVLLEMLFVAVMEYIAVLMVTPAISQMEHV